MHWKDRLHIFLSKFLPICRGLEGSCFKIVLRKHRQPTAYVEDKLNWVRLCPKCAKYNNEYWQEMWDEYYRGRL